MKGMLTCVALAGIISLAAMSFPAAAAERFVIGELFVNTSCPYCPEAEIALDTLLMPAYGNEMTIIRYHTWWPSPNDPYYQYNTNENTYRNNYYQNLYTPHLFLDGGLDAENDNRRWPRLIEAELAIASPLTISLDCAFDSATDQGTIDIQVFAELDPGPDTLRLRVALTESNILWQAPNGLPIHNQVFRDMIPSLGGVSFAIPQGDTAYFSFPFTIGPPLVAGNCELVVFVQNDRTRAIIQGNRIAATLHALCDFVPGDVNSDHQMNGLDIVYAVNYLKGIGDAPPQTCDCLPYLAMPAAADANGDCVFNGIDVIYMVNYIMGIGSAPRICPHCFGE